MFLDNLINGVFCGLHIMNSSFASPYDVEEKLPKNKAVWWRTRDMTSLLFRRKFSWIYECLHEIRTKRDICVKQHKQQRRFLIVWGKIFMSPSLFLPTRGRWGQMKRIFTLLHNSNEIIVTRNDSYRRFR